MRLQHGRRLGDDRLLLIAFWSHGTPGIVYPVEDCACVLEEDFTFRREAHAARRSHEQSYTELVLEILDLAADRRLGDVQSLRGPTHVTHLGNGNEVFDLREAHVLESNRTRDQIGIGFSRSAHTT